MVMGSSRTIFAGVLVAKARFVIVASHDSQRNEKNEKSPCAWWWTFCRAGSDFRRAFCRGVGRVCPDDERRHKFEKKPTGEIELWL